jgi:hypothetical protein
LFVELYGGLERMSNHRLSNAKRASSVLIEIHKSQFGRPRSTKRKGYTLNADMFRKICGQGSLSDKFKAALKRQLEKENLVFAQILGNRYIVFKFSKIERTRNVPQHIMNKAMKAIKA